MNYAQDRPPTIRDLAEKSHRQHIRNKQERLRKNGDIYSALPTPPRPETETIPMPPPPVRLNAAEKEDVQDGQQLRAVTTAAPSGKEVVAQGFDSTMVLCIAIMCLGAGAIIGSIFLRGKTA